MARRALLVGLVVLCTIAVPLTGGVFAAGPDAVAAQDDGMENGSTSGDGEMNGSMQNDSTSDDGSMGGDESMGDDSMQNDSMDDDGSMDDGSMENDSTGDSDMSDEDGMDGNDMSDSDGGSDDDSLPLSSITAIVVGGLVVLGGVGVYVTRG